jgi:hypothetical protein
MICRINGIAENYGTVYTAAKNLLVIGKKLCAEVAQNSQHWGAELQKALRRISKISAQNSRSKVSVVLVTLKSNILLLLVT